MPVSELFGNAKSRIIHGAGGEPDEEVLVPDDVSELTPEEPGDLLEPDPKPARKGPVKKRQPSTRATAGQKRQIQDALVLMMTIPGGVLQFRDPVCAAALLDNAEEIAAKAVPLITRNPGVMAWFLGNGAPWMDWVALALALQPVAATIWGHHVSKSIGHDHEGEQGAADYSQYTTYGG